MHVGRAVGRGGLAGRRGSLPHTCNFEERLRAVPAGTGRADRPLSQLDEPSYQISGRLGRVNPGAGGRGLDLASWILGVVIGDVLEGTDPAGVGFVSKPEPLDTPWTQHLDTALLSLSYSYSII